MDPAVRLLTAGRRAGTQRSDAAREGEGEDTSPASTTAAAAAAAIDGHGMAALAAVERRPQTIDANAKGTVQLCDKSEGFNRRIKRGSAAAAAAAATAATAATAAAGRVVVRRRRKWRRLVVSPRRWRLRRGRAHAASSP